MFLIVSVIIGMLLLAAGIMDFKRKSISRGFILILMLACMAGAFINQKFSLWEAIGGFSLGLCAVGLSMASREQIGRGDGLVIAAVGFVLGFRKCLFAVCMASIIMTLVSVLILAFRKGNRNTRLPFIPALFAGYVMSLAAAGL